MTDAPDPDRPGFAEVVQDFIEVVRRAGIRVSVPEAIDARRALTLTGLERREQVHAALAATLAKRAGDQALFDDAFDRFFGLALPAETEAEVAEAYRALADRLPSLGEGGSGRGGASPFGPPEEVAAAIEAALEAVNAGAIQSPLQVGLYALRAAEAAGIDGLERDLDALADAVGDHPADAARVQALREGASAFRAALRTRLRAEVERRNPRRLERARAERIEREPLLSLRRGEAELVQREVRRLGEALRDRLERRRRRHRRGRLDVRRTARLAARTGGVPARLVYRRRRRERPRLIVLVDISESVREVARFFLILVHAMQEAFRQTRSFVFVRDAAEVTDLFDRLPAAEAMSAAYRQGVGASTDYGRALRAFVDGTRDTIDKRTTVVVLGDARANYLDPAPDALATLAVRAARVLWINPEERRSWGLGDSVMPLYQPYCTATFSVRTLADLRAAMDRVGTLIRP
ncbi:MAG: VWA domain-containing protein [Sandaracinaceae bacterium]